MKRVSVTVSRGRGVRGAGRGGVSGAVPHWVVGRGKGGPRCPLGIAQGPDEEVKDTLPDRGSGCGRRRRVSFL